MGPRRAERARFQPRHILPEMIIKEGRLERSGQKPRIFVVLQAAELLKLKFAHFADGVTPSLAARLIPPKGRPPLDIREMYRSGFNADGVNPVELYEAIKYCGEKSLFGVKLREQDKIDAMKEFDANGKETEKSKEERLKVFHDTQLRAIAGKVCDPNEVCEEQVSLSSQLNRKDLIDKIKADIAAAYLSAEVPDDKKVAERAIMLGENMVGFISSTFKDNPTCKQGKWLFCAFVARLLYPQEAHLAQRNDFLNLTVESAGFSAKDAYAWLAETMKNAKKP